MCVSIDNRLKALSPIGDDPNPKTGFVDSGVPLSLSFRCLSADDRQERENDKPKQSVDTFLTTKLFQNPHTNLLSQKERMKKKEEGLVKPQTHPQIPPLKSL